MTKPYYVWLYTDWTWLCVTIQWLNLTKCDYWFFLSSTDDDWSYCQLFGGTLFGKGVFGSSGPWGTPFSSPLSLAFVRPFISPLLCCATPTTRRPWLSCSAMSELSEPESEECDSDAIIIKQLKGSKPGKGIVKERTWCEVCEDEGACASSARFKLTPGPSQKHCKGLKAGPDPLPAVRLLGDPHL